MGHRANYVIVRNGTADAYYDQWGAMGCIYVLADGPEPAVEAAGQERTDELMDWAFAEAGYLIDFDERTLIAFGYPVSMGEDFGEEHPAEITAINEALLKDPGEFLRLIAPKWPQWRLQWDSRGVDAFAAHLRRRGISTIQTQPNSHPPDCQLFEHQA